MLIRFVVVLLAAFVWATPTVVSAADQRPNIVLAIADDWGWPHAGAYGDPVVKTPTFDRLAREGVLCQQAYVSSPSCTPSRGSILTGQWHWRLEGAANLWSVFPDKFLTYPELFKDLDKIKLSGCFPDSPEVRGDVADYYFEVQRFDALVGTALKSLQAIDKLDTTIVFMTGDHRMPFPRSKSNLYDSGVRVALAARWPAKISAGRRVDDFISLTDLAPTFLDAAGVEIPEDVTGRSLMSLLTSGRSRRVDAQRDAVLFGKERHVVSQEAPDMGGCPSRAIRTHDFLYIRNFRPDRWPNGTPNYKRATIPGA